MLTLASLLDEPFWSEYQDFQIKLASQLSRLRKSDPDKLDAKHKVKRLLESATTILADQTNLGHYFQPQVIIVSDQARVLRLVLRFNPGCKCGHTFLEHTPDARTCYPQFGKLWAKCSCKGFDAPGSTRNWIFP